MTKARHVLNRTNVCHGLCAVAFLGLSLNAGAVSRGIDRATGQAIWDAATQGKTTTIGGGNGSMKVIAPYKPSTVDANGNVALKTGPGDVNVNGQSVPVSVNGTIGKGDIANAAVAAAGCAVGGGGVPGAVVCGGAAIAIPLAMNWMSNAGVRINPQTKALEKGDESGVVRSDGYRYRVSGSTQWFASKYVACGPAGIPGLLEGYSQSLASINNIRASGEGDGQCSFDWVGVEGNTGTWTNDFSWELDSSCPEGYYVVRATGACSAGNPSPWIAASIADAVGLMNNSRIPNADIVRELDAAGQSGAMQPQPGTVSVTGPASVVGPTVTSVTNNSTTNTTTNTTTTTNNYTYNTNTVTNNSSSNRTTTSTAVKNPDGTTTTTAGPTTNTTTNPGDAKPAEEKEQPTQCDKYPDSLGCAQLDTPTAEIPRETKTITFEAEDMLGGGQCPADVMTTLNTLGGRSVKVVDWQTFCGMAVPLRALVMGLAAIMAFFIIMPGGVRE